MENQNNKFDCWCIVELMGHARIAGNCTEQSVAGVNMLRVEVPENELHPAFTRFIGGSAIYAINPVDEKTARATAHALQVAPINAWNLKNYMDKYDAAQAALPSHADKISSAGDDYMDDDFDENDNPI